MKNAIIYIIGFPGVGKYTIANEIIRQQHNFRLVDNHLINDPIFRLIKIDGKSRLPERIWDNVKKIWEAVLDTMIYISPPDYSFVLTNALFDSPIERAWYEEFKKMAQERKALFIPVRILCSVDENKKRITAEERAKRFKDINPDSPARHAKEFRVLSIEHPNVLDLDVTDLEAEDAARIILKHTQSKA